MKFPSLHPSIPTTASVTAIAEKFANGSSKLRMSGDGERITNDRFSWTAIRARLGHQPSVQNIRNRRQQALSLIVSKTQAEFSVTELGIGADVCSTKGRGVAKIAARAKQVQLQQLCDQLAQQHWIHRDGTNAGWEKRATNLHRAVGKAGLAHLPLEEIRQILERAIIDYSFQDAQTAEKLKWEYDAMRLSAQSPEERLKVLRAGVKKEIKSQTNRTESKSSYQPFRGSGLTPIYLSNRQEFQDEGVAEALIDVLCPGALDAVTTQTSGQSGVLPSEDKEATHRWREKIDTALEALTDEEIDQLANRVPLGYCKQLATGADLINGSSLSADLKQRNLNAFRMNMLGQRIISKTIQLTNRPASNAFQAAIAENAPQFSQYSRLMERMEDRGRSSDT